VVAQFKTIRHPERSNTLGCRAVEGSVLLALLWEQTELIPRQARDDGLS
jgi:hypothetical protein